MSVCQCDWVVHKENSDKWVPVGNSNVYLCVPVSSIRGQPTELCWLRLAGVNSVIYVHHPAYSLTLREHTLSSILYLSDVLSPAVCNE